MNKSWESHSLADVVEVASGQVDPTEPPYSDMPHVGGDNIESDTGRLVHVSTAKELGLTSGKYLFGEEDVLYSKIRPALNKVVAPDFKGICSADIYPIRPRNGKLCREYLVYLLRSQDFLGYAAKHSSRTNIPKINREALLAYSALIPPLTEQRRIAAVLDKADAIKRKREEGNRLTEELLRSTFLEMFGDPETNPKGWQRVRLETVLRTGLRNGVSPSTDGTVSGRVLILSAITGRAFNAAQVKDGRFMDEFETGQLVNPDDFLICRGNGNRSLVGCGRFPCAAMPGTVFPDTMIAARIDFSRISRVFFEHLWASDCVRRQIEAGARTTNGTYKVNQQVLGAVEFPLPPLVEQERFARIASKLGVVARQSALQLSEELFGSLVQRAFRGEL